MTKGWVVGQPRWLGHRADILPTTVLFSRYVDGWRDLLHGLHPDTVVRWHRQGFLLYWRWKCRRSKPGHYFDQARSWHFAATGFYETHTRQEDTKITVGDIFTIEGGLVKSLSGGAVNLGAAYYGQWKVTDDDFNNAYSPTGEFEFAGRNRGFGIGPEVNIPLASRSKLYGFFNLRYFWETGNRSTVQGETLVATLTFPIPSVLL